MSTDSFTGEHLAHIQTCTILVTLLHTAVHPSTLSFSHPEFLKCDMSACMGNLCFYNLGNGETHIEFWMSAYKLVKLSQNIITKPSIWQPQFFLEWGLFKYKMMDEYFSSTVAKHKVIDKTQPLLLTGRPSGKGLSQKPASPAAISNNIQDLAKVTKLPIAGASAIYRGVADQCAVILGRQLATFMLGHCQEVMLLDSHYACTAAQVPIVGIMTGEIPLETLLMQRSLSTMESTLLAVRVLANASMSIEDPQSCKPKVLTSHKRQQAIVCS
ncbi:hypothetical protein POSPLADRAFT_1048715 [Postia placenta MAD-698-R-SB12]|uniref:Uncharacterized protein n=1 Tax=Postia placenta MAD-698-R-SB12 TaxID=670580 RepID=A0A1X6MT34_9APHY|nr:hypothetical protein POSPLADRAFT_1048715 [Postia placenta MAD-698-R-SB12]OSX59386.1 hypothetical protein POSPLADRAFT_1048715 [Postia placenta MAD-698-R-SB12]